MEACDFWNLAGAIPAGTAGDWHGWKLFLNGRFVCEVHDPTGEPSTGDPSARFGGQGVETDPWEPD